MNILDLTYFMMEINAAVDTGNYADVTVKEIIYHIDQGDLVEFLEARLIGDVDLAYFQQDSERAFELNNQLFKIMHANQGQESENFGINNNGLCLLVAYVTEIIQQIAKEA